MPSYYTGSIKVNVSSILLINSNIYMIRNTTYRYHHRMYLKLSWHSASPRRRSSEMLKTQQRYLSLSNNSLIKCVLASIFIYRHRLRILADLQVIAAFEKICGHIHIALLRKRLCCKEIGEGEEKLAVRVLMTLRSGRSV